MNVPISERRNSCIQERFTVYTGQLAIVPML